MRGAFHRGPWLLLVLAALPARASGPDDARPPAPEAMVFAPHAPGAAEESPDGITTDDGRALRGRILDELPQGYLLRTADGQTLVIPYARVVDIFRGGEDAALVEPAEPAAAAPPAPVTPEPLPPREELMSQVMASPRWQSETRSVPLAYALEVLIPGAGLMYAGSLAEGVAHLVLVVLMPGLVVAALGAPMLALWVVSRDTQLIAQMGVGLGINLFIILAAALLSARVGSILRAGPAASQHNQKLLGDLVREARVDAWQRSAHPPAQVPPPPHSAEEDPSVAPDELEP